MRTSKIGQWAEARGAWVINVPRLSFQDIVDAQTLHAEEGFPRSHRRQETRPMVVSRNPKAE